MERNPAPPNGEQLPRTPRILVVDDEPAVRQFLSIVLQRIGYTVEVASGGVEALELAGAKPFDVVLTDLVMPRIDGIQVTQRVKQISPETEVVIITGYPSSETVVAATRAGAVDYLPKSPDPAHLEALISKVMQIRDLRSKAGERDYYLRMAQMDGLTELFNRNAFHGFLEREGARALRSGRDLSLLVADFTSLSLIHQDYGTLYGDRVVRRVAHALRTACRAYDIVARIDAGRFAVLAPDTDNAGGLVLAHRLSSAVAADEAAGDRREIPLALAVGAAGFTADAREIPQLVEKAERACGAAASTREHVVAAADLDS